MIFTHNKTCFSFYTLFLFYKLNDPPFLEQFDCGGHFSVHFNYLVSDFRHKKRNRDYLNVSRDVRPRSAQIPDMARPFLFYKGNYEVYMFASVQIQQRV